MAKRIGRNVLNNLLILFANFCFETQAQHTANLQLLTKLKKTSNEDECEQVVLMDKIDFGWQHVLGNCKKKLKAKLNFENPK